MSRPLTPYHLAMLERAVNYYGQNEQTKGRGVEVVGQKCGVSDTTIWRALKHKSVRSYREIEAWIEGLDLAFDVSEKAALYEKAICAVNATDGRIPFDLMVALLRLTD